MNTIRKNDAVDLKLQHLNTDAKHSKAIHLCIYSGRFAFNNIYSLCVRVIVRYVNAVQC